MSHPAMLRCNTSPEVMFAVLLAHAHECAPRAARVRLA